MSTPPPENNHPANRDSSGIGRDGHRPGPDEGPTGDGRGGWVDGAWLALGTLTVLPARMPSRVDRVVGGRAMVVAPLVGMVVGGISAGVVAVAQALRPDAELLAAVLGVLVVVVVSGALHLDGLADFADALGSRRARETMLRIMKQSDIGPFGVVAIVMVLLLDVAALTACIQAGFGWQAALIAVTASRLTLPWTCRTTIPSARPGGLGAMVAATVRPIAAVVATVVVLAGALALAGFDGARLAGSAGAVLLAVVVSILVARRARRALGGVTGDVLGATVELALPVTLLTLALTA
ncbi:adenosylcobinamide-GDP ribazoletransferase [Kribbella sp. NPDC050124]|uniref:adenosylcobinamide-GDP ribazoletransferase n=1 Tax=Kribbella sp. NPDC050124 TaxID=3364114 RepID=UPI0037B13179